MKISSSLVRVSRKKHHAFTIIDLIVAIAMIAILSGILFSARATTRPKPGSVECKNNLRQAGAAIEQYAQDHTNSLPGPIWSGIWFGYRKTGDPNSPTTWSLPYHLTDYLGIPAPDGTYREADVFKCPSSYPLIKINSPQIQNSGLCYLSTLFVTNRPGASLSSPDVITYPFGRPSTPFQLPIKVTSIKRPSEQWAIVDADQKNVPTGATYYAFLSPTPVHNNRPGGPTSTATSFPVANRNYLYFDGSVRSAVATGAQ